MNTTLFCDSAVARGIAQRTGLEKLKALAVKTLWLQEVVRERGLQVKSIASNGNNSDLGTKLLPVARLNPLRRAIGIVVPGELSNPTVEDERVLDHDCFFWGVVTTWYAVDSVWSLVSAGYV